MTVTNNIEPKKVFKESLIIKQKFLFKIILLSICLFLFFLYNKKNNLLYTDIFKEEIIEIHISLSNNDWEDILDNAIEKEYKNAKVSIGEYNLENVAIRTKGGSTLRNIVSNKNSDRYSFRLNFGKHNKSQTLAGLDNMVLNNSFSDPSYMREHFTYKALEFIDGNSPLFTFANVYVNNKLIGLYYCGEHINSSFIKRNYPEGGNLYKADVDATFLKNKTEEYPEFEHKDGDDKEKVNLKKLIEVLNSMENGEKGNIETVLNVDSVLKYIAINTILMSYDSYNGPFANNFYLYEMDEVFYMIPWDYNMSIDGFSPRFIEDDEVIEDYLFSLATKEISILEPIYHTTMEERPLISKLLSVPEYEKKYLEYIHKLIIYFDDFDEKVGELTKTIRPYIENDPTRLYSMRLFELSVSPVKIEFLPDEYTFKDFKKHKISKESIIILMKERIEFVKKELDGL